MTDRNKEIARKHSRRTSIWEWEAERIRASMTLQEAEEEAYFQNSLLPCPFCGGYVEAMVNKNMGWRYDRHITAIICPKCGNALQFRGILSPNEARDMWNRRTAAFGGSKTASHYQLLDQQPIEIMQTLFSADEFRGFLWGNVIKYALRYGHKDERRKEAEKIAQYAQWLAMAERGETVKP